MKKDMIKPQLLTDTPDEDVEVENLNHNAHLAAAALSHLSFSFHQKRCYGRASYFSESGNLEFWVRDPNVLAENY